jgi:putative ABC transport system substrate-binding protein
MTGRSVVGARPAAPAWAQLDLSKRGHIFKLGLQACALDGGQRLNLGTRSARVWRAVAAALWAVVCAAPSLARPPQAATPPSILVLQSEDEPAFTEAVEGLTQQLRRNHPAGSLRLEVSDFSKLALAEVDRLLTEAKPALVVTLGSQATVWAQGAVRGTPLLFGMVLDPQAQGIDPARAVSPMTGVSMQIPLSSQFERLRQVLPNARRIGTVYDARNQNLVNDAKREAGRYGLTLVGAPVESAAEVPEAFRTLAGKVDALWSFPDTTVYTREAAQFILLFSFRNRLPLMGFSRGYVRAGALFALYADYKDVGRQLGELAHDILSGRSARDIPLGVPRRHALALNLRVAEALGAKVSAEVRASAEELFK